MASFFAQPKKPSLPGSDAAAAAAGAGGGAIIPRDMAGVEQHSMLKIRDRVYPPEELRMALLGRTVHTIKTLSEGSAAKFDVSGGGTAGGKNGA